MHQVEKLDYGFLSWASIVMDWIVGWRGYGINSIEENIRVSSWERFKHSAYLVRKKEKKLNT
jgi:hypothetical protein